MIQFSVIMPTYNQAGYIRNAIRSLMAQTYNEWELIIVNDGCTDNTEAFIKDYLSDERISYLKNSTNQGIGVSINMALEKAKYDYIAYLPSDDHYFTDHLQSLKEVFEKSDDIVLAYTNMKSEVNDSLLYHKNEEINGLTFRLGLQMVQTAHKKTNDRWTVRKEWVSEDLYKTFWYKLTDKGRFHYINKETCHWAIHKQQRHRIMNENNGGHINRYRQYYHVQEPIKIKVSDVKFVDEEKMFAPFHTKFTPCKDSLKILLVGELSYNQERIYALEEVGHQLYGLWTQTPVYSFSNVGHLPFGHVTDLDYENWEDEIRRIKPDIIYGLLNFCAVPLAYEVLIKCPDIPFVWHYKEGPFLCFEYETWDKLITLYTKSDGVIFLNEKLKKWYEQYIPRHPMSLILDGDLPKQDYFTDKLSPKLSAQDGDIHTVIAGRMVGVGIDYIKTLAKNKIHIHLYNESYDASKLGFMRKAKHVAPNHFHVHSHCDPFDWTEEFSRYDAGWLHCFNSSNYGKMEYASWNDLNIPARISTMMAAGLPCIQKDNSEHLVAMQSCVRDIDCGIFFKDCQDLAEQLHNTSKMNQLQKNAMKHRMDFSFDEHVPDLISFFREVIENKH